MLLGIEESNISLKWIVGVGEPNWAQLEPQFVTAHWRLSSEEKRCRALWNVMIAPLLMQLGVEIAWKNLQ